MPEQGHNDQYSIWVGLIYIFNLVVGTGALTLPGTFSKAGWLLGFTVIIILAFISYVTVTFVIEAMATANALKNWNRTQQQKRVCDVQETSDESILETNDPGAERNSDSEDTPLVAQSHNAENSESLQRHFSIDNKIEMGEMASMFFSQSGITLFYLCFAIYLYGDLSIYGAAVAKSLMDVGCTYQPSNLTCNQTIPEDAICWEVLPNINRPTAYKIFLTAFVFLLGPFVFFNVQKTKYLQLLTSVMRWMAFSTMILYAARKLLVEGPQGSPPAVNLLGVPGLFGACVYSFMCHHSLPALITPIANKSKLNSSIAMDYSLIAFFYLLLALTGVFAFQHVEDLYTLDFWPRGSGNCNKGSDNIFVICIDYFVTLFPVFTLSTSFPIIAITLRNNLKSLFLNGSSTNSVFARVLIPLLAIIPPYAIALLTEDLGTLVSFTGLYAGAGIQYIIPSFLVYYARQKIKSIDGFDRNNKFASPFSSDYWLLFIHIWAIACMILGSVDFVESHVRATWIRRSFNFGTEF